MHTVQMEFEKVRFCWPSGQALHTPHLRLHEGEFVLISGPSGAGKSTLLRLMVRFEEPDEGEIRYQGTSLAAINPMELRREVALVQQNPVMGTGTVRETLLLPYAFAANQHLPLPDDAALTAQLQAVQLAGVPLTAMAATLSMGQKQRLSLARTLLRNPSMLLLDEPTSALDADARHTVETLVEAACHRGVTVVMITHTGYRPPCPCRTVLVHNGTVCEQCEAP